MDSEFEDLFGSNAENTETEATEAEVEETTEVEDTVEEVEEATETVEEAPVETVAETGAEADPTTVPYAALKAEREKARTSKADADALRQQIADMKAAAANSAERPDFYSDPEAYADFVEQRIAAQVEQKMMEQKFHHARTKAIADHGEEFVNELADWATSYATTVDPHITARALDALDPVQFLISVKKRQEAVQALETDEEAFIRRRAAELGYVPAAALPVVETPTQPTPRKPVGPKSIASVSSVDSSNNRRSTNFFDAIDNKE